ncbi:MAG: SDR family oxidoreductase [Gemmatimonadales bacterium]
MAVVAGASRGIGLAVAQALTDAGARVARAARSLAPAREPHRLDLRCDLTRAEEVMGLAEQVRATFGVPDVVVHAAGSFLLKPLEQIAPAEFAEQLAANLGGAFHVARAFLPAMRERGGGRLITIGSVADHRAFAENAAYSAAKFGLRGLHESLREEFRGTKVLCTLISPGPTDTAVWDPVDPDHRPGFLPRAAMLRPADVAEAVLWVATRPDHVDVDWIRLGPANRS